jgi:hypothetical protein
MSNNLGPIETSAASFGSSIPVGGLDISPMTTSLNSLKGTIKGLGDQLGTNL